MKLASKYCEPHCTFTFKLHTISYILLLCKVELADYYYQARIHGGVRAPPIFRQPPKKTDRVSSLDGGNFYKCYFWLSDARKSHLRSLFSKFSWGGPSRELHAFGAGNSGLCPQSAPPLSNNLGSAPDYYYYSVYYSTITQTTQVRIIPTRWRV
jgi:hypothetical protein